MLRRNAVILETLRVHPNTGTIIERTVPDEGAMIDGYFIPGRTIVGVNAWVLHRSELFGHDTDMFRPERWLDATQEAKLEMSRHLFSVSRPRFYTALPLNTIRDTTCESD